MIEAITSSRYDKWITPQPLFDKLNEEFHFTLDPCCLPHTRKCENFYTPKEDGLKQKWFGSVFCNPPYGKEIRKWISKCFYESFHCDVVVMLIPVRSDTEYWQTFIMKAAEVRFLRHRVKFHETLAVSGGPAPFGSCIVVFRKGPKKPEFSMWGYL